ncbi:hypothetical protein CEXT_145161 [Caerostris extrusa]|uniref:Uncharacterized protein n=1 Tax=Caerostris extrusa TaxID=172846 RepID=A0AAV4PSC8_CAEEX|nr:hypothetical protein CEXT_145161 [Caerostris extrusa]
MANPRTSLSKTLQVILNLFQGGSMLGLPSTSKKENALSCMMISCLSSVGVIGTKSCDEEKEDGMESTEAEHGKCKERISE